MKLRILLLILTCSAIICSVAAIILTLSKTPTKGIVSSPMQQGTTSIRGAFDINGVIPAGASISLVQKEYNTRQSSNIFASNLPVVDESPWSFNTAQTGKSYEIQAQVIVNGSIIATSDPLDVSAPAQDEILTINITSSQQTTAAIISGTVAIDGYIPDGATITIQGRKLGEQKFQPVETNLPALPRQIIDYTKALAGTSYDIQGVLYNKDGQLIGASNTLTVTAPAVDEFLTINSTAQTPSPTPLPTAIRATATQQPVPTIVFPPVAISGSMNFNGAAPANSRIVIFAKPTNASNYQVAVDNISPTDGITWVWNSPQNATWYNIIAILKQRQSNGTDKDIATSTPITIAAPATGVTITINSGYSLSAPTGGISVNCQTYNGGPNQNTWNVVITFQSVPGAGSYWYQVGSTNGGNDLVNTANPSGTVSIVFKNNTTYYARYAYATASVVPLGSSQYSGFSSTQQLQCSH